MTKDRIRRAKLGIRASLETRAKMSSNNTGSKNPRALLDESRVSKIKDMLVGGMNEHEIASIFGVSIHVIKRIKYGKSWSGITIKGWDTYERLSRCDKRDAV